MSGAWMRRDSSLFFWASRNNPVAVVLIRLLSSIVAAASWHQCEAGLNDNYPFSVLSEQEGDGHRIVARNNGPAPVSVRVSLLYSSYATPDRRFPVSAVVPPNGGLLYLGHFKRTMSGVGYSFRYQSSWMLGDFNVRQAPDAVYRLPYPDGTAYRIGQSPGGPITTHRSRGDAFAVDIGMAQDTPIVAARDGIVIYTEANQIYGGKSPDMLDKANEVRIQHEDGTIGIYAHLAHGGVYVYPGQRVRAGERIGLVGSTGYSSGPHLHFAVQKVANDGETLCMESLPFRFYLGDPPKVFSPQYGMVAVADYSRGGSIPKTIAANDVPVSVSTVSTVEPNASVSGGSDMFITVSIPPRVRAYLTAVQPWQWFAGMVGLVVLVLMLDKWRTARRQHAVLEMYEPAIYSISPEAPAMQGQRAWEMLVKACFGDRARAERLVEYEHRKAPSISRDEAALRAHERLRRDRR